jgi:hypothetical protein
MPAKSLTMASEKFTSSPSLAVRVPRSTRCARPSRAPGGPVAHPVNAQLNL